MFINTNDNINLYVNEKGSGIPCIYIHGGPGSWSKDFELFCGVYLEKNLRMIYMDQRGCGRSGGNGSINYSISALVKDIETVRKELSLDKVILLSHSFGGIIAVNYAYKYPQNIKSLILLNSTLNLEDSLFSQIEYGCDLLNYDLDKYTGHPIIKTWREISYKLIQKDLYYKLQYKEYENFLRMNVVDEDFENHSMSRQAFDNEEYFKNYYYITKYIKVKTLIISGDQDYAIGIKHHINFKFENYILKNIKGKHTPYLEDTFELVKIIKNFISKL
ncbi:alpha/beta fold hydrolase [[Clostridium] dakarense]|uniref:alpha/beta fold hydrolase n=1 Tax=Faecalimicrobium dakarense TaxID=1301100 RepID=UPI0004B4A474|nr:alpha/beta hydrolase [[Clostridium] dakarense]